MGRMLVVCDVQPAYAEGWDRLDDLMALTSGHDGPVTMLVNAEEHQLTSDMVGDCMAFWSGHGMSGAALDALRVVDKGYAWLRGWMDNGADEDAIVRVLRRMRADGAWDSRDLDPEVLREAVGGDGWRDWMEDEPLALGWIDEATVRSMDGCLLCGGHREECLREVELLLRAYGVRYELLEEFVYGEIPDPAPAPVRR